MMKSLIIATFLALMSVPAAQAETRTYGQVDLTGLARDSWPYNPSGESFAMVCNVNGPDGFLSVRSGPGTDFEQVRAFNRLAILTVDTRERRGNWVRIVGGQRTHTKDGTPQDYRPLDVQGWAHDGYLCDFLD